MLVENTEACRLHTSAIVLKKKDVMHLNTRMYIVIITTTTNNNVVEGVRKQNTIYFR